MTELALEKCAPVAKGMMPLNQDEVVEYLNLLEEGWMAVEEHHLERSFTFPNFAEALAFVNRVGALAEQENHHPDLHLSWGKVKVVLWTHSVGGLSKNDFILAAKIDTLGE